MVMMVAAVAVAVVNGYEDIPNAVCVKVWKELCLYYTDDWRANRQQSAKQEYCKNEWIILYYE